MPGERARSALTGSRFADLRWVAETASTQSDVLALARRGAPEGIVLVADHQTAGRGRHRRIWAEPPESSLLVSVLFRPRGSVAPLIPLAVALSMTEAVLTVAAFAPRLKWPNDLVWAGDGSGPDRKLAGVLAESDWPHGAPAPDHLVVGIGLNVNWPLPLPDGLRDVAVSVNHVCGRDVDRELLLEAFLHGLDRRYGRLLSESGTNWLVDDGRARSATLGRRVRVERASDVIEGIAVDISEDGHLVVDSTAGERLPLEVGDVVHLRPVP